MNTLSKMGRCRAGLGAALALVGAASASGQTAWGMSLTLEGAKETAGASAAAHALRIKVVATGGEANLSVGNSTEGRTEIYQWRVYTTFSGGSVPVRYGSSTATEGSTLLGSFNAPATAANGVFYFNLPVSTTLGTPFKILLTGRWHHTAWGPDPTDGHTVSVTYDQVQDVAYASYRLRGFPLEAVAVDSRKTYAPPNKDGAYPAVDANADLRSVAFAGWAYRGGLFLGNAAGVNSDQSGVARIQCQASDPGGLPPSVYTLSLLHIGTPAFFRAGSTPWNGAMGLEARVAGTGSGAVVPASLLTWTSALDPATCTLADTVSVDDATPANEYLNLKISGAFPARTLLKAADEVSPRWRYLGGSTYAPPSPAYPYSECKPHLWSVDVPTATDLGSAYGFTNVGAWS